MKSVITERSTTSARLIVCLKKLTLAFPSIRFFPVRFVVKRYILQQKCLKGQIGTCLLGTPWYNFSPVHRPWEPQCTASQTDRRTDGRHDDANSRSYRVAVRSTNYMKQISFKATFERCDAQA